MSQLGEDSERFNSNGSKGHDLANILVRIFVLIIINDISLYFSDIFAFIRFSFKVILVLHKRIRNSPWVF